MTKRTPQLEAAILAGFAEGLSLSVACRRCDVSRSAFLQWKAADPDLAQRYEAAQLLHAESLVDECLELADDLDRLEGGGVMARFTRQQIDTRLKVARLYFKRHEAAADRRAREEERRQAERTPAPHEAPPERSEDRTIAPAPLRFPISAADEPLRPAPVAIVSGPKPEPERRYAVARR